jgi:hypothetical protein
MTNEEQKNELANINTAQELSGIDLNKAVDEALAVGALFEKMGIKEATLVNGNYYNHNQETGTKVVVTEGCIVEENENTVTVTLKKISATAIDAVNEVENKTQKALGAFAGKSQPWVSTNSK